jgi:hypothetical protein
MKKHSDNCHRIHTQNNKLMNEIFTKINMPTKQSHSFENQFSDNGAEHITTALPSKSGEKFGDFHSFTKYLIQFLLASFEIWEKYWFRV